MTDKLTHHHLTAEAVSDQHGTAIMLTQQDGLEEPNSVLVHPWQLRAVCEHFDIVASDQQAAKTIATLQRRMRILRDRIDELGDWLTNHSDHRNADLSQELASIGALHDMAREWCADFDGGLPECFGEGQPAHTAPPEGASAPAAQASLL